MRLTCRLLAASLLSVTCALGACKKGASGSASCTAVADHFARLAAADLTTSVPDLAAREKLNAEIPPMHDSLQAQCEDHAWAPDARACMVAATTGEALRTCQDRLTAAQRQALDLGMAPPATDK